MNNGNALTFMKVEEGLEVDQAHVMFNNTCNELDRWIKMQSKMEVDGKQEDFKKTYYLALMSERLFKYMFQKIYEVAKMKTKKTQKKTKKNF